MKTKTKHLNKTAEKLINYEGGICATRLLPI